MNLEGRTVLITGAAGNLGSTVARRFAQTEANIALVSRSKAPLDELIAELDPNGHADTFQCDLTVAEQVQTVVDEIHSQLGGPHALLNIAGMYAPGKSVAEEDEKTWDMMMDVNLKTVFLSCKYTLQYMVEQDYGRIVNISSKVAIDVPARSSAYSTAKAGVLTLTDCLAKELKKTGISVTAIVPSVIDTPDTRSAYPDADFSKWVTRDEIAGVMVYLASEQGGSINGAVLPMYGEL